MKPHVVLSLAQARVFKARQKRRFRVLVAGRRFGKTILGLTELIGDAAQKPGEEFWYVAPTYRQAKLIAWKRLKQIVPHELLAKPPNESELMVEFTNGASIFLKGADKPDSLRGVGLSGLVPDEYASMKPDVWTEVLRPALADRQGWALFTGTPCGFNHFYDLYLQGQDPQRKDWYSWQFTTADGGFVSPQELADAALDMDSRTFNQEFNASFETLSGRIYYAFNRKVSIDADVEEISSAGASQLIVGLDFNVSPMSAVLAYRVADELHVFDELEMMNSNTQEMGAEIARRFGTRGLTPHEDQERNHIARLDDNVGVAARKRDIRICPDPSGNARKTSAVVGQTDFSILRGFGFTIDAPSCAPAVVDRINTVNTALCDASGRYRIKIHPRCKKLIKGLDGMTYKPGTKQPDKDSGLDHITDALGYLVCQEFGVAGTRASSFEMHL